MEQLKVTGMAHDGRAIGRIDGQVVFFEGALPGETVAIDIIDKEKRCLIGELKEIIETSPERCEAPCPAFKNCGGCALQMASPKEQENIKYETVANALQRIGKLNIEPERPLMMGHPWEYRNKGIFHIDYSHGRADIGFYAKNSHDLVAAKTCLLFSPTVNQLMASLEERITHYGLAHHIEKVLIRESSANGALMLVFISQDPVFKGDKVLQDLLQEYPLLKSVWFNQHQGRKGLLGKNFQHLHGEKTIEDTIGEKTFNLSPESFFQVNSRQTKVLYDVVKSFLPAKCETIYDLYCGIGSIGICVAPEEAQLIGVELNSQAVKDAKENAQKNGLKKAKFTQGKAEQWIQKQTIKAEDIVIIDPPRKGCDRKLLDALIKSKIQQLIYVSCDPATLARDLRYLSENSYQVEKVQPVDMFPQTAHVETVVLIQREIM